MRLTLSCALVAIASVARVLALQVTPGSSCAAICLDDVDGNPLDPASSSTNTTDIKCMDESFDNTEVGMKYKTCLDCLRKSEKVNGTESDSAWFLCKCWASPRPIDFNGLWDKSERFCLI